MKFERHFNTSITPDKIYTITEYKMEFFGREVNLKDTYLDLLTHFQDMWNYVSKPISILIEIT
jgi:hypothetical protein